MKIVAFLLSMVFTAGMWGQTAVSGPFSKLELRKFTALDPIDTHTHIYKADPLYYAMLRKLNLHILDIVVVDDTNTHPWAGFAAERKYTWQVVHAGDGYVAMCTSFDPYKWRQPGFSQAAIVEINRDFDRGAVAVKIWKNVGMEIKDAHGNYILPDNPVFDPIYKDIASHSRTLIAHVADPSSAWEPPNPASPDYSYYKETPQWYMHDKPHPASKEDILRARDHVLEQNPHLRVVGAHLGSMEANFNQLGEHFDRYPNFAVDLAGRMPYLMLQPRATIIAFITKYQDRLIYATDIGLSPVEDTGSVVKESESSYARDWRFLATGDIVSYKGRNIRGLALPGPILHKLYHDNAVKWFPGILAGAR